MSDANPSARLVLAGPDTVHLSADISVSDTVQAQLDAEKELAQRAAANGRVAHCPDWLGAQVLPHGSRGGYGHLLETDDFSVKVLGKGIPFAVLSGPTFAREVARGVPTAVTIASDDARFAADLAAAVASPVFRAYTSDDLTGVEVGGTVKNIIAIGTGISDGLGFGANARAALITRGLVEITRLGLKLGAKPETFQGLAGLGDLVLTCTDDQSRNRRMGLGLATGKPVQQVAKDIGQVVEGVYAAEAVHVLAQRLGVEMPICEQLYRILHQGQDPRAAVEALMKRALKQESSV